MRFYRRSDEAVVEIRHPRFRFFLLGPFYLLWLRLWKEAVIMAAGVWLLVHGSIALTRAVTGVSSGVDLESAFAAIDALLAAAGRSPAADAAFRELMATLLPFYAAAFTLLAVMTLLTTLLPRYLTWRYAGRGWQLLNEEGVEREESPIYGV